MAVSRRSAGPHAQKTVLANGVRVITESLDHVDSVSLGLWVDSGITEEPPGCAGITHLIEHMLFKGTSRRSTREIAELTDDIGGHVNGLTDREFMHIYARTITEHVETALDLILDLLLNSTCTPSDLEREREVVLQEIDLVQDTPEDWVHDLLLEVTWPDHPLGWPVIGTAETVSRIDRDALLRHLRSMRSGHRILVTAAGLVGHARLVAAVDRLTGEVPPGDTAPVLDPPAFHAAQRLFSRPTNQVQFCLATPACSRTDPSRHAYAVLDTILGGGTSSRLFQEIRENRGLAYNIGSYLQLYRNTGLFTVDAGTNPENFRKVRKLVDREIARLQSQGPSPAELERAKTQTRVAVALAAESTNFRMQHLAASELSWGRTISFEEVIAGVTAVTAEDVHIIAGRTFLTDTQTLVAVGPFDEKE